MTEEDDCSIKKIKSIINKNRDDFLDLNEISEIIHSEVWMEPCIDDNRNLNDFTISSNKSDDFVRPIRNPLCDISLGSHTHPKNLSKGYLGISEPSLPDLSFGVEKLLDSDDPLAVFCTQGIADEKIKCIFNPRKIGCSEEDDVLEYESEL